MKCTECDSKMRLAFESTDLKQYECPGCANFRDVAVQPKRSETVRSVQIHYTHKNGGDFTWAGRLESSVLDDAKWLADAGHKVQSITVSAYRFRNGKPVSRAGKTLATWECQ
jgi:hypothetical protein